VLLERSPLEAGSTFNVDVVLTSRSETPTTHVDVVLSTDVAVAIPEGKAFATRRMEAASPQRFRWQPGTLAKGEHRQRFRFALPAGVPPSYGPAQAWCRVAYVIDVHVAIPYWLNRDVQFSLPIAAPPRVPNASASSITATHPHGQVAGQLYVEAALDATTLVPGEELRGDVSFANVGTKRIRRVEIAFVAVEATREPMRASHVITRYAATLVSGPPPEGETFPFRIALPKTVWPSFDARIFELRWVFQVRVDVVLGADVMLEIPLEVVRPPPGAQIPARTRRALPVGRERLARVWSAVAERLGVSYDETEGMLASRGAVALVLAREVFQGTLGIIANFRYPHLGLDMKLGERGFFDTIARRRWDGRPALKRFTVVGREPRQLEAFFDEELSQMLGSATRVEMDDDGARVHVAGNAATASALEAVARSALRLLDMIASATQRIPVAEAMQPHETAWRAFAERAAGRFEPGRVWVHDASIGGFRCEVGTVFEPDDAKPVGTVVRIPIEPPLEKTPDVEDASLSPAARATLRELAETDGFHGSAEEMGIFVRGVVPDPEALMPRLEQMTSVLRSIRGAVAAGPFR
jgi:hypothetical protein